MLEKERQRKKQRRSSEGEAQKSIRLEKDRLRKRQQIRQQSEEPSSHSGIQLVRKIT